MKKTMLSAVVEQDALLKSRGLTHRCHEMIKDAACVIRQGPSGRWWLMDYPARPVDTILFCPWCGHLLTALHDTSNAQIVKEYDISD